MFDTGVWFAIFSAKDQHHKDAEKLLDKLEYYTLMVPYPSMYEFLNTKFCHEQKNALTKINMLIEKGVIEKMDDTKYRDNALKSTLVRNKRNLSFVDNVIREMIIDKKHLINFFVTFNTGDFIDVCREARVVLVDENTLTQISLLEQQKNL